MKLNTRINMKNLTISLLLILVVMVAHTAEPVIDEMDRLITNLENTKIEILQGVNAQVFPDLQIYTDVQVQNYINQVQDTYSFINRSNHLDSLDLVVATVFPSIGSLFDASAFATKGYANFVYTGSGTVTITYNNGSSIIKTFASGTHSFSIKDDATTTWSAGQLYLNMFPEVQMVTAGTGDYWLYIPSEVSGNVIIVSQDLLSIVDTQGDHNIVPNSNTSNIDTGLIMVRDATSIGAHSAGNGNRFLSPYSDKMLMPKEIAITEGLSYEDVTTNNWSNQELVLGHLNNSILALKKTKQSANEYQNQ